MTNSTYISEEEQNNFSNNFFKEDDNWEDYDENYSNIFDIFDPIYKFEFINFENSLKFAHDFFEIPSSPKIISPSFKSKSMNDNKKKIIKKKTHDKTESGNIRSKIKNHFHRFIVEFMNEKIREINDGKQIIKFRKINYKTTNVRNKKDNKKLIEAKIKEIFKYNISSKYKYKSKNQNLKTLNVIYHNSILKKYLDMSYEEFYTKLFLQDEHPSTVSNKVKFFCDFIKNERERGLKQIELNENNNYLQQIKQNEDYINTIYDEAKSYINYYKSGDIIIKKKNQNKIFIIKKILNIKNNHSDK